MFYLGIDVSKAKLHCCLLLFSHLPFTPTYGRINLGSITLLKTGYDLLNLFWRRFNCVNLNSGMLKS